jgi:hypothetical protein
MINLKNTQALLDKNFKADYNFDMEFKIEDDMLYGTSSLTINGFDDNVMLEVTVFTTGAARVSLIFDSLDANQHNLNLVNNVNNVVYWFKSRIGSKGYFTMDHAIVTIKDEKDFVETVNFLLDQVVSDESKAAIKPITELTN